MGINSLLEITIFNSTLSISNSEYISKVISKDKSILDFGAGKQAIHVQNLKQDGFKNIIGYDFGDNINENHDQNALDKKYDVIYASNVLNVQSNEKMLKTTLQQIKNSLNDNGTFIFNYPASPRKAGFSVKQLEDFVKEFFQIKKIKLDFSSTPVWEAK